MALRAHVQRGMVRAVCPQCRHAQIVPDSQAGRTIRCGQCGQPVGVPRPVQRLADAEAPWVRWATRAAIVAVFVGAAGGLWAARPLLVYMVLGNTRQVSPGPIARWARGQFGPDWTDRAGQRFLIGGAAGAILGAGWVYRHGRRGDV